MRNEERTYEAPRLIERGDAVIATRVRSHFPLEPSGAPLRAAIKKAATVDGEIERGQVLNALALELWLRMRTGKWDRAEQA